MIRGAPDQLSQATRKGSTKRACRFPLRSVPDEGPSASRVHCCWLRSGFHPPTDALLFPDAPWGFHTHLLMTTGLEHFLIFSVSLDTHFCNLVKFLAHFYKIGLSPISSLLIGRGRYVLSTILCLIICIGNICLPFHFLNRAF